MLPEKKEKLHNCKLITGHFAPKMQKRSIYTKTSKCKQKKGEAYAFYTISDHFKQQHWKNNQEKTRYLFYAKSGRLSNQRQRNRPYRAFRDNSGYLCWSYKVTPKEKRGTFRIALSEDHQQCEAFFAPEKTTALNFIGAANLIGDGWLQQIHVDAGHSGYGAATTMIKMLNRHNRNFKIPMLGRPEVNGDLYLTPEGLAFTKALIEKGIVTRAQCVHDVPEQLQSEAYFSP